MSKDGSWAGNKGEWGEVFVLMHLLAHNDLFNADDRGNRIESEHCKVRAIYRSETSGADLAFMVLNGVNPDDDEDYILVLRDGQNALYASKEEFAEMAHELYEGLSRTSDKEYPEIAAYLQKLGLESLKASSSRKADLRARVLDGFVGMELTRSYSIKSLFGADPSLSNASGQAIFKYELPNFDKSKAESVMSITPATSKKWVVDRVQRCIELCGDTPPVPLVEQHVFERNLLKCHWRAPVAVPYALLYGQLKRGKRIPDALASLKELNPAGWPEDELDDYEDALRRYLWAVVFDMDPGTPWRGPIQVDGYLLAGLGEQVLAYQVSRQQSFENYLLSHTKFDTPSTSRTGIAQVEQGADGKWHIRLACAVKYDVKPYTGKYAIS